LEVEMLNMRLLLPAALLLCVLAAGARATSAPNVTAATTQAATVSMKANVFVPAEITVAAGTTIVWLNEDYDSGEFHNVIAENGSFATENLAPGGASSLTLSSPGRYVYYCDLHEGMYGTVVVQ
jgi:plastocyanin